MSEHVVANKVIHARALEGPDERAADALPATAGEGDEGGNGGENGKGARGRGGRLLRAIAQAAVVGLVWVPSELVVRATHAPVSGGIIGMLVLLVLLWTRSVKLGAVKHGADWLLAEMSLFFVPALLAIVDHRELLGLFALKVVAIIGGSTVVVMLVTAVTVELFAKGAPE